MSPWHSKFIRVLVIVIHQVNLMDCYRSVCPEHGDTILRASSVCTNRSSAIYICLNDTENTSVKEFCKNKTDYPPLGQKYVWTGGLRNVECNSNRFQPFPLYENASSRCVFLKSECNEEGQFIYHSESTIKDRRCRCDHTEGYSFVQKPKNTCYCMPRTEDCSCYLKSCRQNEVLSSDYRCVSIRNLSGSTCMDIYEGSHHTNGTEVLGIDVIYVTEIKSLTEMTYQTNAAAALAVILFLILSGTVLFLVRTKHKKCYEKTKRSEELIETGIDIYEFDENTGTDELHVTTVVEESNLTNVNRDSQSTQLVIEHNGTIKEQESNLSNVNGNSQSTQHMKEHDDAIEEQESNLSNVNGNSQSTQHMIEHDDAIEDQEKGITIGKNSNVPPTYDSSSLLGIRLKVVDDENDILDDTLIAILRTENDEYIAGSTCKLKLAVISKYRCEKLEWIRIDGTCETSLNISDRPNKYCGGTVECESLTINNLEQCDAGIYKCRVTCSTKTVTTDIVTINVLHPKITAHVETRMEGNKLRLFMKCKVFNMPHALELHYVCKDRRGMITKSEPDTKEILESFTECRLQVKKSGEYTFVAKNIYTTISYNLNITSPDEITEDIQNVNGQTFDIESVGNQSKKESEILQQDANSPDEYCSDNHDLTTPIQDSITVADPDLNDDLLSEENRECTESTETTCRESQEERKSQQESKTQLEESNDGKKEIALRIVVSLDIGTTYSRYSFISTDTQQIDLSSVVSNCIPTCVLFSKAPVPSGDVCLQNTNESDVKYDFWENVTYQKNDFEDCMKSPGKVKNECDFLSFGIPTKQGCQRSLSLNSVLQFEKFKLELYRQEKITDNVKVEDINGREMKVLDVYIALIRALRSEVLTKIKENYNNLELNDITWVVTVPEAWSDGGIHFVKLACQRGGIDSNKLIIESEFSAVFTFYQYSGSITGQIEENSKCLIADLGGGTWDLIVHEVKEKKRIKRKPSFVSCRYGIVAEEIMNRLRTVTGDRAMEIMEKEHKESYISLMEQFSNISISSENMFTVPTKVLDKLCERFRLRSFAKSVEDYGLEPQDNNTNGSVHIGNRTPENADGSVNIGNISPENADGSVNIGSGSPENVDGSVNIGSGSPENVDGSVHIGNTSPEVSKLYVPSNYERNMEVVGGKLCIKKPFIESLLKRVSVEIVSEMKFVLEQEDVNDVTTILLCGGYSSVSILKTEIQQAFKDKQIFTLEDNIFCISKGALVCGINQIK